MKLLLILLPFLINLDCNWGTDFTGALKEAKDSNKKILIYFSGSDWCTYCDQIEGKLLNKKEVCEYAGQNLILVNADFPKKDKHKLSDALKQQNEELQKKYNPKRGYPTLVLIDQEGRVIKTWEGNQNISTEQFIQELKSN